MVKLERELINPTRQYGKRRRRKKAPHANRQSLVADLLTLSYRSPYDAVQQSRVGEKRKNLLNATSENDEKVMN